MANNLKPTNDAARLSILRFAESMVSPSTLKALKLLLSPCCPVVLDVDVACGTTDYDITLTLGSKISLAGRGQYDLLISGEVVASGDWPDDTATLTLTNVASPASPGDVQLRLFLPTDSAENVGVTLLSNVVTVTFPAC